MFIFDGGVLSAVEAGGLRTRDGELAACAFCTPAEAAERLRPYVWQRVQAALRVLRGGGECYVTTRT
jgi:hypothetical protein